MASSGTPAARSSSAAISPVRSLPAEQWNATGPSEAASAALNAANASR
jgi:hypothetical protein